MDYYLPDSRDIVDLTYDFDNDRRQPDRQTRDDLYCHEVLPRSYDGMLISYAAVAKGRYSATARRRLFREGARSFFRAPKWCSFMGDCGAFSYIKEPAPTYTVAEVVEFYTQLGVDYGLALDHIVPGYSDVDGAAEPEAQRRYELTLSLAKDFLTTARGGSFVPVGVVQGWSAASYAKAARRLQTMGYRYLALGGLVRLKQRQLLDVVRAVADVRREDTRLHLLGVARPGYTVEYAACGVTSFDSTSPLRKAWMDRRKNYLLADKWYAALRIPSSDSPKVAKRIMAGEINGEEFRGLEQAALETVALYSRSAATFDHTLEVLTRYSEMHSPGDVRVDDYRRTLEAKPWLHCGCSICNKLGHHAIVFRGAERNRLRGFHNVGQFYTGMRAELRFAEVAA
jgi:hypothetical protein